MEFTQATIIHTLCSAHTSPELVVDAKKKKKKKKEKEGKKDAAPLPEPSRFGFSFPFCHLSGFSFPPKISPPFLFLLIRLKDAQTPVNGLIAVL
jgi:hypothetical protein